MRTNPKVAVVGCGYWGKNLVRNFAELGALGAVVDADPALVGTFAEQYGVAALDWPGALSDPTIDAIVIAVPAARHADFASAALAAGKHVFVEKPLALDVTQAERLCAQAEQAGLTLMIGHLLQYHPAFIRLRKMVVDGALGRLQYVYSNRLNLGKIRREEDILWSFAPHDISMILALCNDEPATISAHGAYYLHDRIADVTTTHLEFPGGVRAHVFVSWLHPFKEQKLVVVGDRAMAVLDDTQPWSGKLMIYRHSIDWRDGIPTPAKADGEAIELAEAEPLRVECEHFLQSVARGERPRTDGREGVRVLRVLAEARNSLADTAHPPAGLTPRAAYDRVVIHESAYVDEPASIGAGTRIWHFSHVLKGCAIGRNCTIGQNVMIGPDVRIGDGCKIQNNVSIYNGVMLEDGVFCGPSCVFTNVLTPRAEVERKDEFAPTRVGRGATIGANATVVCGNDLGAYSMVAAGAVVTRDVPAHALVAGVPARQIGWVSHSGERLGEDLVCPRTGSRYALDDSGRLQQIFEEIAG